jgi:hypothetical protein
VTPEHVHQEVRCPHGTRLGGCKCLIRPDERVHVEYRVTCPLAADCPNRPDTFRSERGGYWANPECPDVP